MRPRDWFSVGVRLLGLWAIFDGSTYLLRFLAMSLAQASRSDIARQLDQDLYAPAYYISFGAGAIAIGFILLSSAERLTKWAFKESAENDNPAHNRG
jgi:hypothetical protein